MTKLDLPQVTLLFVETRAHKITKRVIDDAIAKINFGGVLIYTDKSDLIQVDGARYIHVPNFPDKKSAGQFYYQHACAGIDTDFALMLEWDAGVKDVSMWSPDFLKYDYIGAPWKVRQQEENRLDVGNGGFTLMSKKLGQFLDSHPKDCPVFTDWDVCRNKRPQLETSGFKWAPRDLAKKFSWELTEMPQDGKVFGFHATFTWPWMLEREEVIERAKLMTETPYLLSKMRDLMIKAPWLETELDQDAIIKYKEIDPMYSASMHASHRTMTNAQRAQASRMLSQRRALYLSQINRSGMKA